MKTATRTAQVTLTADIVVVRPDNHILLIQRLNVPYIHMWALPGGKMNRDETIEECAIRELQEETGISTTVSRLHLIGVFSEPGRDPRGSFVCIAFIVHTEPVEVLAGDDAQAAQWFSLDNLPELAFDHDTIIACALQQEGHRSV